MNDQQRALYAAGRDAAVALRHPDGRPMRRHIVAVEDCVQSFLLALEREGIEGQTFLIAMNDPFDYVDAAHYAAQRLGIDVLDLVDPVGQDFCIDTTKARYVLGYQPQYDIRGLIDRAIEFRQSGAAAAAAVRVYRIDAQGEETSHAPQRQSHSHHGRDFRYRRGVHGVVRPTRSASRDDVDSAGGRRRAGQAT